MTANLEIRADHAEVGVLRDLVDAWLESRQAPPAVRRDVVLVVSELVDNARRHGTSWTDVVVSVARHDGGAIELCVSNPGDVRGIAPVGTWLVPDPLAVSGRGLAIVAQVADAVTVEGDEGTTLVRARFETPDSRH